MKYMEFLKEMYPEGGNYSMTDAEIRSYETKLGVKFPPALYEFYRMIGKNYEQFFDSWYGSLASTVKLTSELPGWQLEGYFSNINLNDIFILGMYEGDMIQFFYKKDMILDDPPLYIYTQPGVKETNFVRESIYMKSPNFSSFVKSVFDFIENERNMK